MQDATDTEASNTEPSTPRFRPRPWEHLETPYDVELWIEEHNRSMQENIGPAESGYGVCFSLTEGGDIFLQTSADGAVIVDVTADAEWVAPLISAATGGVASTSSLWILPDDKLIQLIVGLSSLVATSTLVVGHNFGLKRRMR
ncbi:MAG TPA: hypothetical protein DCW29_03020 [Janthinobacterium sp.]|nr:hypothetical protein [Janthinobacterium sp.]